MAKKLYCVYVYLKEINRTKFQNDYSHYFDEIIFISLEHRNFQQGFFEFSGYQKGLSELKRFEEDIYKIIFINSTFIEGHIWFCRNFMLRHLISAQVMTKHSSIIGIPNRIVEESFSNSVSTWCFALKIKREDISGFDFTCGYIDQSDALKKLKYSYPHQLAFINNWLYPSSALKGWYKAPYFQNINSTDYRRKSISILLEHQFITYNANKINDVYPLSSFLGSFKTVIYFMVMLLDRINLNLTKIAFRIGVFIKKLCRYSS